jgi:signal transduction histidine kinase
MGSNFREVFAMPAGGETVRAFLIFGFLLLALVGIASQLAFREVGLKVLANRLDLVRSEAQQIADAVVRIGGEGASIDFSRVRKNADTLRNFIYERLSQRYVIHHVEILDRFGVRQLLVSSRPGVGRSAPSLAGEVIPVDWHKDSGHIVRVPLGEAEGEVRVSFLSTAVLSELERIRRSLRFKVGVAAALAVAVLVAGFFYVLYLIRKNRKLEQARQSAERASYVGLLASNLAHEIRNPLNAMNINVQMLEEEFEGRPELHDGDWGELLDLTKQEIKRLENLARNFLSYARPAPPNFELGDLNEVVQDVVRFLEVDFRQSGVELLTALEPLLPTVEFDATQLRQALINLMVNANQVVPSGGRVTVRTRPGSSGEVVVEVEDDGPGMTLEVQERAFEVFYSRRGGGTGLGLPIAKQIVEHHGGALEMNSVQGEGTTFLIRLPRRHDRPLDQSAAGESSP